MAGNPRTVAVDRWITWDGVRQRLPRGQVMDVTPGSALEREIGRDNLVPRGPDPAPAEGSASIGGAVNEVVGHLVAAGVLADESAKPRAKSADGKDGDA
jgi:hypothetical protein